MLILFVSLFSNAVYVSVLCPIVIYLIYTLTLKAIEESTLVKIILENKN